MVVRFWVMNVVQRGDDLLLEFADEESPDLPWEDGDVLFWIEKPNGDFIIKLNKATKF